MPRGIPRSWIHRRMRRVRRLKYDAVQRIGLSTAGAPNVGEPTLCIAYMCPWAHACPSATFRPALVGERQCLRKYPDSARPATGLTDHALDTLADQRDHGERLGARTIAVLDQVRPSGPSTSYGQKKPARPVWVDGFWSSTKIR